MLDILVCACGAVLSRCGGGCLCLFHALIKKKYMLQKSVTFDAARLYIFSPYIFTFGPFFENSTNLSIMPSLLRFFHVYKGQNSERSRD